MLTIPDIIAGVLAACAMIGAYVIEWRRSNNAERLISLEARIASVESQLAALAEVNKACSTIQEAFERLRRNL